MKCRNYRRNPGAEAMSALVAPLLPYAVLGVVVYFWGGKIATLLGSKISGVDTTKLRQDTLTVQKAIASPATTSKDVLASIKVATMGYVTPAVQAKAIEALKVKMKAKTPVTVVKRQTSVSPAGEKITSTVKKSIAKYAQDAKTVTSGIAVGLVAPAQSLKADVVTIVGGLKGLFSGGIWSSGQEYISQNEQKEAIARIKASKGL